MCEITNKTYYAKYSDIVKDISSSDFITLDFEFSGIMKPVGDILSLFDSMAERYTKLRRGIDNFVALQMGLSAFEYNRKLETYQVSTYTFYLFQRVYSNPKFVFSCDSASLEFLVSQNFDFNKVFYHGITYLHASEEKNIRKDLESGTFLTKIKMELNSEEKELINAYRSQVCNWMYNAEEAETMILNLTELDPFLVFLIRNDLESFSNKITVCHESPGVLTITKIKRSRRNSEEQKERDEELIFLALGFTKLIQEIISMKKPLVGHNMFIDLLMLYKMFIGPLPKEYNSFKSEILKLFPEVYDTKFLSHDFKLKVGKKDLWTSNILPYLYKFFKGKNAENMLPQMPVVSYKSFCKPPQMENYHDSGFDSYVTGYVFLNIAYFYFMWNDFNKCFDSVSLGNGPLQCFGAVKNLKNRINLVRCKIGYISLDGPDPVENKTDILLIESIKQNFIDITKISDIIAKYDRADIRALNSYQALIATSSESAAKVILRNLRRDKNYRLNWYVPSKCNGRFLKPELLAIFIIGISSLASLLYYKNCK